MPGYVEVVLRRCSVCTSLTERVCYLCGARICPREDCRKDHEREHHPVMAAAAGKRASK